MKWNRWTRQTHRWLAILFTVAVLVNILLNVLPLGNERLATRVGLLTLVPLALLLLTGLYLFVLPYLNRNGTRSRTDS
jgi:quinol-cytochrome oxidoreductase complex cytochrome b subunit